MPKLFLQDKRQLVTVLCIGCEFKDEQNSNLNKLPAGISDNLVVLYLSGPISPYSSHTVLG